MTELNQKNSGKNIKWHNLTIGRNKLEKMRGHKGMVIWFTGLSGSGKSTLANALNEVLHLDGLSTYVLDGDNIRHGLCKDLGFSDEDREENIRRIGEVANLFLNAGIITITAFVSPFNNDRNKVRKIIGSKDFIEVYCSANIDVCEKRDTKGLYKKARLGEIKEFTGISSPYEAPANPELVVDTGSLNLNDSVEKVINYLREQNLIERIQS
jgi:adenylylsulfate kinase